VSLECCINLFKLFLFDTNVCVGSAQKHGALSGVPTPLQMWVCGGGGWLAGGSSLVCPNCNAQHGGGRLHPSVPQQDTAHLTQLVCVF
jgi:hypothetical protein